MSPTIVIGILFYSLFAYFLYLSARQIIECHRNIRRIRRSRR